MFIVHQEFENFANAFLSDDTVSYDAFLRHQVEELALFCQSSQ